MDYKKITREQLKKEAYRDITTIPEPVEMDFYDSPDWDNVRNSYKKNHPQCELCLNEGKNIPSSDIHHIKPLSLGGHPLSTDNLIALCGDCHLDVHSDSVIFEFGFDTSSGSLTMSAFPRVFKTKLMVVKDKNPDGTDRQQIITQCKKEEMLNLAKAPIPHNKYKDALFEGIGVFLKSGEQIGYIDYSVAIHSYLSTDMEHGADVKAKIVDILGGEGNFECIIEITKGDIDWGLSEKCREKGKKAKELIQVADRLKNYPDNAIPLYKQAMAIIKEIDEDCKDIPKPFRWTLYPINEITILLAKHKRYRECLEEIEKYESMDDRIGLYSTRTNQLNKRKVRMIKILSKLNSSK